MEEGNKGIWVGVVAFGVLATGVGLYLNHKAQAPAPVEQAAEPAPAPAPVAPPAAPALNLPSLENSDDFMRTQLQGLSTNPGLADWLKTDDIVRRMAAAMDLIAAGKIPKDSLDFLIPKKKFSIVKNAGRVYLDPKSYTRYDGVGKVVESLDAKAGAALFKGVQPLLQSACQELGHKNCDVQGTAVKDITYMLRVPQVDGMLRLRLKVVTWEMTDAELENLTPPQKVLIRMGPKNSAKVQGKLRDFAVALGVPESQLPQPTTYSPPTK